MFNTRRLIGAVVAAALLLALPGSALAERRGFDRSGFHESVPLRCSDDWQYVGYGVVFYIQEEALPAKEQLLREIAARLRRTAWDCRTF
jgi:hypothetical protein